MKTFSFLASLIKLSKPGCVVVVLPGGRSDFPFIPPWWSAITRKGRSLIVFSMPDILSDHVFLLAEFYMRLFQGFPE